MNKINMETLVAFKIGRGGGFFNPEHLSVGLFNKKLDFYLSELNENEAEITNNGDGTGCIDIDGDYNTIYVKKLENCNVKEISTIWNDDYGYDFYLSLLEIEDFKILRKFKISAEDVFWSDDMKDTCNAENNGIEEIDEETYFEAEHGYQYEEIDSKYYRKEEVN